MVPGRRCWWTPCGFAPFPDAACAGWFDGAKLHGPGGGRLDELALGVFVAEIPALALFRYDGGLALRGKEQAKLTLPRDR